ncbi:hypothetical protein LTR74_005155 [Friedmanniomyces endolithicus]|nr:hypothetical protein LTR74_005155 [Friedmanniomyces endolithicus]
MGDTLGLDLASKKQRVRKDYAYRLDYRTRWADNDMFHHLNNPIYGVLIDSIINDYLIKNCGYNMHSYPRTALVASTYCDYFGSVAYPSMLGVGLRVVKLGNNSVTYECGIFEEDQEQVKAVGGFTQIYRGKRRPPNKTLITMTAATRASADDPTVELNGHTLKRKKTATHDNIDTLLERLRGYGNPALHVTPDHKIELRSTDVPTPSPQEALLHVRCTGICGSDMHLWHRGAIGPLVVDRSCILGHEPSGVVLAIGSEVTNVQPGDRVAIEPGVPCRKCWLCDAGKYNLCEDVKFAGVCPSAGTIRRFIAHDARQLHKLPDSMTFAQGALVEPLSVVLHAIKQCKGSIGIGRPALICGAGPIGLCALAAAKATGAWPLVITDVDQSKLDFARQMFPGIGTYLVEMSKTPAQCSEEIRARYGCGPRELERAGPSKTEYNAPSTVLECTGIESSVATAAYSCRRNGTVMVIGVGRSIMNNVPFMQLSLSEIELRFINRYSDTWPAGINALAGGQVMNLDALVTHTFPLEQAVEAMNLCADPATPSIKVQIVDDTEIEI